MEVPTNNFPLHWRKRGNLKCIKKLGEGAFGEVYLTTDSSEILSVVKKVSMGKFVRKTFPAFQTKREAVVKIHREVNILKELIDCENIVKYLDHWVEGEKETEVEALMEGNDEDFDEEYDAPINPASSESAWTGGIAPRGWESTFYLIQMEYCGNNLRDWMNQVEYSERSTPQVSSIITQVLKGLNYAHGIKPNGIIHRDLYPQNIFIKTSSVDGTLVVKIGDFGLSRFTSVEGNSVTRAPVGYYIYQSPEVAEISYNGEILYPYDCKSDIFSLGLIYFELLHNLQMKERDFLSIRYENMKPLEKIAKKYHRERALIEIMLEAIPQERVSAAKALEKLEGMEILYNAECLKLPLFDPVERFSESDYCTKVLTLTDTITELQPFAEEVKIILEYWFPKFAKYLVSPSFRPTPIIEIQFGLQFKGILSSSGDVIEANGNYFLRKQDTASVVEFLISSVFSIQKYNTVPRPPIWLRDGIAAYCSYYIYTEASTLAKPRATNSFRNDGETAAYFLNWVNKKYSNGRSPDIIQTANWLGRDGNFNEDSFWQNATGKDVQQLWDEMIASSD